MEPVTHALTSLAIARAARGRLPRFGASMLVLSGVVSDLDFASYFGGAGAFLKYHRTLLHSLPGAALLACATAGAFCYLDRQRPKKNSVAPLRFGPAVAVCCAGVVAHLALDLSSVEGVQLLWPFKSAWSALSLARSLDPWILLLLIGGILLPELFRLVSEEIGDRKKGSGARRGAVATLLLVIIYMAARAGLHRRAVDLLLAREYHGREPLSAGAFPASSSPFEWRGLVSTDNTIEEVPVSPVPGGEFDPDRSLTHYKPDPSPALDAGQRTAAASRFLAYAQFPLARVDRLEDGYRFELLDLRFASEDDTPANIILRVDFDADLRVTREEFRYASSSGP